MFATRKRKASLSLTPRATRLEVRQSRLEEAKRSKEQALKKQAKRARRKARRETKCVDPSPAALFLGLNPKSIVPMWEQASTLIVANYPKGHNAWGDGAWVGEQDYGLFSRLKANDSFGEVRAEGVHEAAEQLDVKNARVLFDCGSGRGKFLLQLFACFPNLEVCVGIELGSVRHNAGVVALQNVYKAFPDQLKHEESKDGKVTRITEVRKVHKVMKSEQKSRDKKEERYLELRNGNLFDHPDVETADVVILETDFTLSDTACVKELCNWLCKLKAGTRLMTYHKPPDVYKWFENQKIECPLTLIKNHTCKVSWSESDGRTFAFWRKTISD